MSKSNLVASRFACPCCGYPTLAQLDSYQICELCSWEDDGQGDEDADEVYGGPNSDYSLAEARKNFLQYRVMYAPGRDQRITGDSRLEYETKGLLIDAFLRLRTSPQIGAEIEAEIARLEKVLREEITRQVREIERRNSGGA